MGRRTVLLLVAVLLAGLGTALVFLYVQNADARAAKEQRLVRVLFAKTYLAPGAKVSEAEATGAFELREVAENSVAPGAISDTAPIADKVALAPVVPGQQILPAQFGDAGQTVSLPIPDDKIAISVQLDDPARVAGFVSPGNEVAIMITMSVEATEDAAAGGAAAGADFTRVLLPRVQVIATGPTTLVPVPTATDAAGSANTEQLPKAIMTLAVSQDEAQRIVYAQSKGTLYFALLSEKSKVDNGTPTDLENLFG